MLDRVSSRHGAAVLRSVLLTATLLAGCDPPAAEPRDPGAAPAGSTSALATRAEASGALLGEGFLVWESSRDGSWGIWTRDLAGVEGAEPRRLSPLEPGRSHCCPHVSPDGEWVAYLSLPPGGEGYAAESSTGPLHLVRADGSGDRVVAPAARTYFENRAVVWRGPGELIFIDAAGRTRLLELAGGETRPLTDSGRERYGWLIDPTLRWATTGRPNFSPYQPDRRIVAERAERGGCQPYFSFDGRWGYWVAGAGGPIQRLELATGQVSTILRKGDERLHPDFRYLYFPMLASDGSLFVFGASPDEHDHLAGNYEIFAAESDPDTLEITGPVTRLTRHPGADRFPDIYRTPLPLGRHGGEAPFEITLRPPGEPAEWEWSFGDGSASRGEIGQHRYERPGGYRVEARRAQEVARGLVRVRPPAAPRVSAVEVREGGLEVRVVFDEPVVADGADVRFESGREILSREIGPDGVSLRIRLAEPLRRGERLRLAGVGDRASRINRIEPMTLEVEPPRWPSRREGLVFLWQRGDASNLVFDRAFGASRAAVLERQGRAHFDRHFRMKPGGGLFAASAEWSNALRWALQATNELTLEGFLTPGEPTPADSFIVDFGERGRGSNFSLIENNGRLFFSLLTSPREPTNQRVPLAPVEPGSSIHVVLTYNPGVLTLDLNGERVLESEEIQGGFFHWRSWRLAFGGRWGGEGPWYGALEGVAIYDRVLGAGEARENHRRYRRELEGRSEPPALVVEATLTRASPMPSLGEIRPYREALVVEEFEVERILEGELPTPAGAPIAVARWALLDGQPLASPAPGENRMLRLEPFDAQPQLESVYTGNALGRSPDYFAPP